MSVRFCHCHRIRIRVAFVRYCTKWQRCWHGSDGGLSLSHTHTHTHYPTHPRTHTNLHARTCTHMRMCIVHLALCTLHCDCSAPNSHNPPSRALSALLSCNILDLYSSCLDARFRNIFARGSFWRISDAFHSLTFSFPCL
jgi:hypothetical protein